MEENETGSLRGRGKWRRKGRKERGFGGERKTVPKGTFSNLIFHSVDVSDRKNVTGGVKEEWAEQGWKDRHGCHGHGLQFDSK